MGAGERSRADIANCLLELRRLVKALRFYAATEPSVVTLIERTLRAFESHPEAEALELEVRGGCLYLPGDDAPLGFGDLETFARELEALGMSGLAFEPGVSRADLQAVLPVLALEPEALRRAGGLASAVAETGVESVRIRTGDGSTAGTDDLFAPDGSELDAAAAEEADPADKPEPEVANPEPDPASAPEPPDATTWNGWLEQLAAGETGARDDLLTRIREQAPLLREAGRDGDVLQAALAIWRSRGEGDRRADSDAALAELLVGEALEGVIRTACGPTPVAAMEASRILLQLAAEAAPQLVARLASESEPERSAQLSAILIAMGEPAAASLIALADHDHARRAGIGVRLLGEIRSPDAVPTLARLLYAEEPKLRDDSARALVCIDTPDARSQLVEALGNPRTEIAGLAAFALGAARDPGCVADLGGALARAAEKNQTELAGQLCEALGRIAHPDAVEPLVAVLGRKSLLRGRSLRTLKLAATAALAGIEGAAASEALRSAGSCGDGRVESAAREALAARGEDPAGE